MSALRNWVQRPHATALRQRMLDALSRALDCYFRSPTFLRSLRRLQDLSFGLYARQTQAAASALYAWNFLARL
jgi:hypothetical protein